MTARRLTAAAIALLLQQAVATPLVFPYDFRTATKTISVKSVESTVERGSAIVRIEPGDSLTQIAAEYGVRVKSIMWATGIKKDQLKPGMLIRVPLVAVVEDSITKLPPGVVVHEVQSGETLSTLAGRYGLSIIELISANPYTSSLDRLKEGDRLMIPSAQRGLIVRIKPGQDLVSVADFYGVDVGRVAKANGVSLPSDVSEGDYVLLPGVMAEGTLEALNDRRQTEIENRKKRELLERYQRYLVFVKRKKQLQYERYLVYLQEKQERKAREAQLAKERAIEEARQEAIARERAIEEARQTAIAREQSRKAEARALALQKQRQQQAAVQAQQARTAQRKASASKVVRASYDSGSVANTGFQWPLRSFTITSGYGRRGFWIGSSNFHTGLDMGAPTGTPIYAASSGRITASGWGSYGINVFVSNGNMRVIYGHMSRAAVQVGQYVDRGDLLGYVGCTGICTGPHLHFEVQRGGQHVNPYNYLP
ncbi:peptidoglycan DD-metalloendopeptidase family protein [Deinococcus roseus]|nr:peptidoglycan DD-metalloendopeptidase family protein [Deinococcus roseus]